MIKRNSNLQFIIISLILVLLVSGCEYRFVLINRTRAAGYAMGEKINLQFLFVPSKISPDSIAVNVLERKSGFIYKLWAKRGECQDTCRYEIVWDGRKSDGSWPSGGRYEIFASALVHRIIYSDTVEIGLAD